MVYMKHKPGFDTTWIQSVLSFSAAEIARQRNGTRHKIWQRGNRVTGHALLCMVSWKTRFFDLLHRCTTCA